MKRAKLQHLPTITNTVLNGTLDANLHIDILRTIVLDYVWSPRTHQTLVSTCKSFQTWIMNRFLKSCMFDISDLSQEEIAVIYIEVTIGKLEDLSKKHKIILRYVNRIPFLGCLSLVKMFLNNREQLGPVRTTIIPYLMYRRLKCIQTITNTPITTSSIIFEYLSHVIHHKDHKDNIRRRGNVFLRYFNPIHLPNDIRDPHPAWMLLSKYMKAWTDPLVIPTLPCPEMYQYDVVKILQRIVTSHKIKCTTYKIHWKKLQLCMDISADAFECVHVLIEANMFQIRMPRVKMRPFDGFEILFSRTLDVFPEERLTEMLECKDYAYSEKSKLLDETLARHIMNGTVPHRSIIRFVNIHITANERFVNPLVLRICKKYAVVDGIYPKWGIVPITVTDTCK